MLETCREIYTNKYIEKNLCVELGNYQESLRTVLSGIRIPAGTRCFLVPKTVHTSFGTPYGPLNNWY